MKLSRRLALASALIVVGGDRARGVRRSSAQGKARRRRPRRPGSPGETPSGPVDTVAKWAFIQDFNTGAVLLDKSADEPMPPSSMTKLMTIYLVYEQLKKGQIKLTDTTTVSARAAAMGGSRMFLDVGKPVGIEDLIRGVIVDSGNDAATALAEAVGGTQEHFVDMMNAKAKELGLTHSTFRNPTGWPDPGPVHDLPRYRDGGQPDHHGLSRNITNTTPSGRSNTTTSSRKIGIRWCRPAPPTG